MRIWSFTRVMVEDRPQYARVQISESAELVYENGARISIVGNAVRLDGGPVMELRGNWIYDAATKTIKPGFIRTFE